MLRHVNQFSWMAMTLFPTLMVAMVASQIEEQMKKTGNIVQKILQECSMSPEIRRELKIFSLELLHRDFQFTAYNIIPVDCTILRTIFGAVATYLIIFIQFQADDGKK
ncbi:putative gustatory receptor 28b [Cotesia typhae]|uniref:putative gustatory receptor 28b n=1 Tax=Cotesia typhae TaxID=2053667 RepID=UPI003D69F507